MMFTHRDEEEFSWFKPLLRELEEDTTAGDIFELNTFVTGELNLEEMLKKAGGSSGNLNMKYAGRPNWGRIFKEIKVKERQFSRNINIYYES